MAGSFVPYIAAEEKAPETTVKAIIMGLILGLVFAIGNAYLGLKVGMTVSASIPAAVISMGLFHLLHRDAHILENNLVQTIASSGEAVAAGVIFTVPALAFLGGSLSPWISFLLSLLGGVLGVLLMVPLRHHLMVEEHKTLPYPEGTACASILKLREESLSRTLRAIYGLVIGVVDKVCMGAFRFWPETATLPVGRTLISVDTSPALLGVGFIIGPRYSFTLLAGGAIAWWVLLPLIASLGVGPEIIEPAHKAIQNMSADEIWTYYIRYIGVGCVATAGIISLIRLLPLIFRSLKGHFGALFSDILHQPIKKRTEEDLPLYWIFAGVVAVLFLSYILPTLQIPLIGLLLLLVLGFFFVALTSITCGLVGSSSNPASGMIICTLLITCYIFLALTWTERAYFLIAMSIGSIIGIAIAVAADTSQDLKTGYLLGATPRAQQIGALIGVVLPALLLGWILVLMDRGFGLGSATLPAPQATLMALVVEGVMEQSLPLFLLGVGALLGISVEMLGVRSLAFALGVYLPLSTSVAIGVGGALAYLSASFIRTPSHGEGILVGSGLIAGDALTGVILAALALPGWLSATTSTGPWISLLAYLILASLFFWISAPRRMA